MTSASSMLYSMRMGRVFMLLTGAVVVVFFVLLNQATPIQDYAGHTLSSDVGRAVMAVLLGVSGAGLLVTPTLMLAGLGRRRGVIPMSVVGMVSASCWAQAALALSAAWWLSTGDVAAQAAVWAAAVMAASTAAATAFVAYRAGALLALIPTREDIQRAGDT